MDLRAEFAINHAISGLGLDYESALELLKSYNDGMTQLERDERDRLITAVDNLISFAVSEEFQMYQELSDTEEELEEDEELDIEEANNICHKYNYTYASVENGDIEYCMSIAAGWIRMTEGAMITYMTMGDERVRPWHLALEGETYSKADFPAWMIPPIENNCRCFLVSSDDVGGELRFDVKAKIKERPKELNPVFKDSIAKGGKIFSEDHPYFQIPKKYQGKLVDIANRIKMKYYAH